MVNYQKTTKSSVSHLLKLIDTCVTGIEVRRRKGEKNIKILYNLLMRWDFLMGKIHRVWRRESKLLFHIIIHLFTTLNCLGEIIVGDSTDPFLFSPSPCLPLPCHTQNTTFPCAVCPRLQGDGVFLIEEKRGFPAVLAFVLRNDHAQQTCACVGTIHSEILFWIGIFKKYLLPSFVQLSSDSSRIPLAAQKLQFQEIFWKMTDNWAKHRERENLSFPHEEVSRLQHTLASTAMPWGHAVSRS